MNKKFLRITDDGGNRIAINLDQIIALKEIDNHSCRIVTNEGSYLYPYDIYAAADFLEKLQSNQV